MRTYGEDLGARQHLALSGILGPAPRTVSVSRRPIAPASRIPAVRVSPASGVVRVAWRATVASWSVARPGAVTPAVPVPSRPPSISVPVPVPISGPGSVAPSVVSVVVPVIVVPSVVAVLVAIVSVSSSSSAAGLMVPFPWRPSAAASEGSVCHRVSSETWCPGRRDGAVLYAWTWSSRGLDSSFGGVELRLADWGQAVAAEIRLRV